jgi:hypothetical protein
MRGFLFARASPVHHEISICVGSSRCWVGAEWVSLMQFDDDGIHRLRFLIHDRDSKFTRDSDEVFRSEGIRVIKAPVRAPKARAHAERWIGSVRRECLDRLLILGRRHLH